MGLGIFFGKGTSGQKSKEVKQGGPQLVLVPKAQLPSEEARWTFTPDVPMPTMRKEQRREVVHWTIREAQNEIAPGVIYDDAWGFEGHVPGPLKFVVQTDASLSDKRLKTIVQFALKINKDADRLVKRTCIFEK